MPQPVEFLLPVLIATTIGVLRPPETAYRGMKRLRAAAPTLNLKLEDIETETNTKGLESAFYSAKQKQVGAILTHVNPRFFAERRRIVQLAAKQGFQLFTTRKSS